MPTAILRIVTHLLWCVCLFLMLNSQPAYGQERASVSGMVTDSSGAAVVGVQVTVTDARTNVTRTTETNGSGLYNVGGLAPDPYTVAAQAKGFKRSERPVFTLEVAQAARIDFELQIGDVSQSVS